MWTSTLLNTLSTRALFYETRIFLFIFDKQFIPLFFSFVINIFSIFYHCKTAWHIHLEKLFAPIINLTALKITSTTQKLCIAGLGCIMRSKKMPRNQEMRWYCSFKWEAIAYPRDWMLQSKIKFKYIFFMLFFIFLFFQKKVLFHTFWIYIE